MSEVIVPPSAADTLALLDSQQSKYATKDAVAVVTTVGDYLPYVQLFGGNSLMCKESKIGMGHFGVTIGKNLTDLGTTFIAMLLSWRPKAMIYSPKVISYFDHSAKEFQDIQATADQKDSNKGYGPEFLLWLPELEKFATFFLGNKTGRNEAGNLISAINNGKRKVKINSHLIKTEKYSWHGPESSTYDLDIVMPPTDDLRKVLEKFNNPKPTEEEAAEATTDDARR